jgi:putative transposase
MQKGSREELFKYITGLIKNKKCIPFRTGGVEDHIHIVFCLHPSVALSDIVKDIKLSTTEMIKREKLFPSFGGWQEGYGAFTYSIEARANLIAYVENQEEHHRTKDFTTEFKEILKEHKIEFEEKYLL